MAHRVEIDIMPPKRRRWQTSFSEKLEKVEDEIFFFFGNKSEPFPLVTIKP